jgi:hypothetical protein
MYLLTGSSILCLKAVKFVLDCIVLVMVKIGALSEYAEQLQRSYRETCLLVPLCL